MSDEIYSINQILPNADAGYYDEEENYENAGEKAVAIRSWMKSLLRKIVFYKAEHQRVMDEAATALQHALSQDIVSHSVLPFLELPSYTFVLEDHEDGEEERS